MVLSQVFILDGRMSEKLILYFLDWNPNIEGADNKDECNRFMLVRAKSIEEARQLAQDYAERFSSKELKIFSKFWLHDKCSRCRNTRMSGSSKVMLTSLTYKGK